MDFFARLRSRVPKFAIHGMMLMGGTTLSQIIPALISPLLTRFYTPTDFGVFVLANSVVAVFGLIACLRYDLAVVLPSSDDEAKDIVSGCLIVSIAGGIVSEIFCLFLWFFAPNQGVADFALPLMAALPIGMFLSGLQRVQQMWCLRIQDFRITSAALLAQAIAMSVAQVILPAIWGSNPYFLIIGIQVGLLASAATFHWTLRRQTGPILFRRTAWSRMWAALVHYKSFPLYSTPYGLISQGSARLVPFIIATFASTALVGQFALAQRVVYLPLMVILRTASQLYFSHAAQNIHDPRLARFVRQALLIGVAILVPIFTYAAVIAEPTFAFVFGAPWREAGTYAAILSAPALMLSLSNWLDRTYDILGRQRLGLIMEIANNLVSLIPLYLTLRYTGSLFWGAIAYAAASSLYRACWMFTTIRIARFGMRTFLEFTAGIVVIAAAILTANWFLAEITAPPVLRETAVGLLCVAIGWIGVSLVRKDRGLAGFWSRPSQPAVDST